MSNDINNNIGTIKISEDVIAGIANLAATEIDGVIRIIPKGISSIKDIIPNLKNVIKGVAVVNGPEGLSLTMQICVKLGCNMQTVAVNVQNAVADAVQTMTGLAVKQVNVVVAAVAEEKPQKNKLSAGAGA